MLLKAVWEDCPGIRGEGRYAYSLRDHCTSCAPFWERIPLCPHCGAAMRQTGKRKCPKCKHFVNVERE